MFSTSFSNIRKKNIGVFLEDNNIFFQAGKRHFVTYHEHDTKCLNYVCKTHIQKNSGFSGLLSSIQWLFFTDFSGQTLGPTFKDPEDGADNLQVVAVEAQNHKYTTLHILNPKHLVSYFLQTESYKQGYRYKASTATVTGFPQENFVAVKSYETLKRGNCNCMQCIRSLKKG